MFVIFFGALVEASFLNLIDKIKILAKPLFDKV